MSDESVGGFALKWSMRAGLGGSWFVSGNRPGADPAVGLPAVRIHVQNVAGTDPSAKEIAEHLLSYFDAEAFEVEGVECEAALTWHPLTSSEDGSSISDGEPVEIPLGEPWLLPGTDVPVGWFRLSTREVPATDEPMLDAAVVVDLLSLVCVTVSEEQAQRWTADQRQQAVQWAGAVHLSASDNDVEAPPRPAFLDEVSGG